MKTTFIKLLLTIVALTCFIGQISAQNLNFGSYSDSFHIRHDYVSGETVTITIASPMHVTMHTYSTDIPVRPADGSAVAVPDDAITTISVREASTGHLIAQQSGSLYRKFVFDANQSCITLPVLDAGTYSVTVYGDESTLLTMEGFLTEPPHSLDGREAGQPVDLGTFSTEFGYSHICDTSGEGYWAGYGSPSNDVFYKFTLAVPMYVVVTHWGSDMMSDVVPSRLSVLACGHDGIIQSPALGDVYDMSCEDNLMGNDNIVNLLVNPDRIPEIEHNDPLCASWHGMLRPGTYFVVSEGPYRSSNYSQAYNGPIRTNIKGFLHPAEEARRAVSVGTSQDGVLEFSDGKFIGMTSDDSVIYNFTLDTTAEVTVATDADNLVLEKDGSILCNLMNPGAKSWEELPAGEYTLSLKASENRIVNIRIYSEKHLSLPDVPSDNPSTVPEILDKKNNFIRVLRPFREGSADPDTINLGNSRQTIEYYDGLGRPVQTVRRRESPTGDDLATYVRYEYGRPAQEWSETPAGQGRSLVPYSLIVASAFSAYDDAAAFSLTEYEDSPLSRTVSVTGPGEAWHAAEKSVGYDYLVNDTTGVLGCLRFDPSEDYNDADAPVMSGMYPAGTLTVTKTVSEDGTASYSFTDKAGQTVLSRIVDGEDFVDTYYVYDVRRMLRAVVTPAAVDSIRDSGVLSSSVFNSCCYAYGYDERGRCVEASRPGCGVTRTVYSENSYPLFVQTPELASEEKWKFDIPDIFGRKALTGICSGTYESMKETAVADIVSIFGDGPLASGFWKTTSCLKSVELHQAFYYDDYTFLNEYQSRGEALAYEASYGPDSRRENEGLTCRGMLTGSLTRDLETGDMRLSAIYYDRYGNITQTVFENNAGGVSVITNTHDFLGNVLTEKESHSLADGTESLLSRIHEYDRAGRLVETVTDLDGVEVVTRNTYDPVGRLKMTVVSRGEVSDTTMHSYNVRSWLTSIENEHWSAVMRYNNPVYSDLTASFTGNISEWEWTCGNTTDAYSLEYDALSRIKESRLFRNGNHVDALSESGISYDSNGNILSLTRTGEDGSAVNDLTYHYDGNRLECLVDNGELSGNYAYDADGNMTFDGRTGMSLTWNDLGLVKKVSLNDTDLVNYSYLADGTKVSALDDDGDGLLYLGSLIYKKQGESISLESAGFAGGRFVARETSPGVSSMVPMIHVTDHLGSVRAVVNGVSGEVVETNDYYPFGSRWNTTAGLMDDTNRFRYNSKEEQFNFGTPYIDYGARQYDPVLGRWFAQDPLAEKYYGISPYAFCAGNPVKYLDPDGEDPTLPARMAIGAAIGGAVSGTAAIIKGKSFTEVVAATAGGAVDGAIGAIGFGVGGKILSGIFGGGIGNSVEQLINKAFGNQSEIDWGEAGISAAFGAVTGTIEGTGDDLGKYIEDFYSSDKTVKSMAKEIKDNSSRKMTNKKAAKEAEKMAKEAKEREKNLVEKSAEVITNTWNFYYNLQDE